MALEIRLITTESPWSQSFRPTYYNGAPDTEDELPDFTFEPEVFVPVFARPYSRYQSAFWVDRSAVVVTGDVHERYTMTPFERTQAEYHGFDDLTGGVTRDAEDSDYTPMLDPDSWVVR